MLERAVDGLGVAGGGSLIRGERNRECPHWALADERQASSWADVIGGDDGDATVDERNDTLSADGSSQREIAKAIVVPENAVAVRLAAGIAMSLAAGLVLQGVVRGVQA